LARAGHAVQVWEAAERPGGLLLPVPFRGVACDLGSHRIHGESLPLIKQAAPRLDWLTRPRHGALILRRRHIDYPLRLLGFLRGLGPLQAARFGLGFLTRESSLRKFSSWERDRAALDPDAAKSSDPGFEHFVRERVGESAYQAFYRPYAEKVWGLPAAELSTVVAKKRISTAHPVTVLKQAATQAIREGWRRDRRPAATFEYPRRGMGALVQALCDEAQALGVALHFGRRFTAADRSDGRFSHILYGGHLSELLPEPARTTLSHRGLYLVYLAFPVAPWSRVDTFYAPEGCYLFGRVSQPKNFSPALAEEGRAETVLCVEVPEGRLGPGRDFSNQPTLLCDQLRAAGILPRGVFPIAARQIFLPRVYPLYRRGWLPAWSQAMRELGAEGRLFPMGRQGLFLHCNIDHCVQIAADLCAHLARGGSAAEWAQAAPRYLDLRVRD
jgi:hypothetical protein